MMTTLYALPHVCFQWQFFYVILLIIFDILNKCLHISPLYNRTPQIGKYCRWKFKTKSLVYSLPNSINNSNWWCRNYVFTKLLIIWSPAFDNQDLTTSMTSSPSFLRSVFTNFTFWAKSDEPKMTLPHLQQKWSKLILEGPRPTAMIPSLLLKVPATMATILPLIFDVTHV